MIARLGEDGEGETACYEDEQRLHAVEEGFGFLEVRLFDTHGDAGDDAAASSELR